MRRPFRRMAQPVGMLRTVPNMSAPSFIRKAARLPFIPLSVMLLYAAACDAVFLTLLLALLCTRRLIAELIVSRVSTSSASTDGSEDAWTRRPAVVAAASCVCINLLCKSNTFVHTRTHHASGLWQTSPPGSQRSPRAARAARSPRCSPT